MNDTESNKSKPGPEPERLKAECVDGEEAVRHALNKPKPNGGWPLLFFAWLMDQRERTDGVGRFARDSKTHPNANSWNTRDECLADIASASAQFRDFANQAWDEFKG